MIQNQYFYVTANSNYKSLKKTVFAVNHFHFQLHKLCSSSLCLLFLSSYCKFYMCDNLVGRLEIWERNFFFFFISCRECYPLKQVSGSCLRELCEFCLPLITLTQAKPLVRKFRALVSYHKHVHVSSVIGVHVHVIC